MSYEHPTTIEDWAVIQHIERDILLLYHQLADYSYIMGDLYWGTVYSLPYWEYLTIDETVEQALFIRNGCLVMLIAMAFDLLDGSGCYIADKLALCIDAVNRLRLTDQKSQYLVSVAQSVLAAAANRVGSNRKPEIMSAWVHKNFVTEYFRSKAANCPIRPDTSPEYWH